MSEEANLDAYLKRINFAGSIAPTLDTLVMVHRLHPAAIPFETLDPLMERPVRLQLSDIEQKLLVERRGGYCFEQNLLLKAVLETMDFKVTPLAARVLWMRRPEDESPLSHMVLLVDVDGVPYLADVGFGGQVMTAPLRLRAEVEQQTPNERYRLVGGDPEWTLETEINGTWRPVLAFDLTPRGMEDYTAMNDAAMRAFRDRLVAARVEPGRRFALLNGRLRTHEPGRTETRLLAGIAELREVLATTFAIALPAGERLDAALERALKIGVEP